jgi:hypothetical protein
VVVETAGSGGVHAYWKLNRPLRAATTVNEQTGEADGPGWLVSPTTTDTIEAAHQRLIYALGYRWVDGVPRPTVADPSCRDRSRVLRLAGTVNYKSARHARILWADLALPAWDLRALIGDLPSPPTPKAPSALPSGGALASDDSYRHIAPADYFQRLAGIEIPASGLVSCPNPGHRDRTPSCHVGRDATAGWYCFGCQAGGGIYDLASVLDGGPTGNWLRAEAFKRARNRVRDVFGTPTPSPTAQHLMPEEAK